jgi:hypothetical protein
MSQLYSISYRCRREATANRIILTLYVRIKSETNESSQVVWRKKGRMAKRQKK